MLNKVSASSRSKEKQFSPLLILITFYGYMILRDAWLSDDAYITFRTVDNFINGYGLTWNTIERVQVYTHPLWMFLNSFLYAFTHEIYFTSIFLSIAISLITIWLLATQLASTKTTAVLGLLILSSSRAYIDYSTSGLENPLTHLLLVLFLLVYFQEETSYKTLFWLSFIAALAAVNRMDTILLFVPALLFKWWPFRDRLATIYLVTGLLPLALWLGFSTFYYGFPFPNTAYAKLNTGLLPSELFEQGLYYYINSLWLDPLTLIIIASSIFLVLASRKISLFPLLLGMGLYLAYILRIGGDFMSGRFFTVPLLYAVLLIVRHEIPSLKSSLGQFLFALVVIIGLSGIHPTLIPKAINEDALRDKRGIADERAVYTPYTGLINISRNNKLPNFEPRIEGIQARHGEQRLFTKLSIGLFGFYSGPKIHIIDYYALADPLLARLPEFKQLNWRIGHFRRLIPDGYEATLSSRQNQLTDPALAQYYDKLILITQGDLFDSNRLREIWHMNLGHYDNLINFDAYRYPNLVRLPLAAVQKPQAQGTALDSEGVVKFTVHGIEIGLETAVHNTQLEISLDNNDDYQIIYFNGSLEVGHQTLAAPYTPDGLAIHTVDIPTTVAQSGFDRMRIFPTRGDDVFGLGHITLND